MRVLYCGDLMNEQYKKEFERLKEVLLVHGNPGKDMLFKKYGFSIGFLEIYYMPAVRRISKKDKVRV